MRPIYIFPSLLTTANLFAGVYGILSVIAGDLYRACVCVGIAMFFDFLDGQIARATSTESRFGVEYDSLADLVSFGLTPGLLAYKWVLISLGRVGIAIFLIYITTTALRLARFNVRVSSPKRFFTGLPTPAAAGLLITVYLVYHRYGFFELRYLIGLVVIVTSGLMVSSFRYPTLIRFLRIRRKRPFFSLVMVILIGIVMYIHLEFALLMVAIIYTVFSPVFYKWREFPLLEDNLVPQKEVRYEN